MARVKITVLRTSFNKEYVDFYVEKQRAKNLSTCEFFKEGQEFITDAVAGMPAGFCPWAWDDIYKVVSAFYADGNFGMWTEGGNTIIACCTDGTRPVFFKIDKLADKTG